MNKHFKINDYTFIIVAVLSVVVLAIGVFSIDYVLNKAPETNDYDYEDNNDIVYEDEINILDEDGEFKKYYISVQDTSFSAELESITLDVDVDSISINGVEVLNGCYPTKYVSFYNDYMIIPFIYNEFWFGGIIVYNVQNEKFDIIDRIDDKYIYNEMETFTSSKDGILINLSLVNEDKIYIDGVEEDVCNINKSKKMKVQESVFIKYNQKKKTINFEKFDIISSINLSSYRSSNNLC